MIIGCYSVDLYCDAENPAHEYGEFPHQFTGLNEPVCIRQARAKGWKITTKRQLCPKCSGKRQKKKREPT